MQANSILQSHDATQALINALKTSNDLLTKIGNRVGIAGVITGGVQTIIGITDGEISPMVFSNVNTI